MAAPSSSSPRHHPPSSASTKPAGYNRRSPLSFFFGRTRIEPWYQNHSKNPRQKSKIKTLRRSVGRSGCRRRRRQPHESFLLATKQLVLELVRQRNGAVRRRLLLLVPNNVRVAGAAAAHVVVRVLLAGSHGRLGDHVLVGAHRRLGARVADVGGTCGRERWSVVVQGRCVCPDAMRPALGLPCAGRMLLIRADDLACSGWTLKCVDDKVGPGTPHHFCLVKIFLGWTRPDPTQAQTLR